MRYWDIIFHHNSGSKNRIYDVPAENADVIRQKALTVKGAEVKEIYIEEVA